MRERPVRQLVVQGAMLPEVRSGKLLLGWELNTYHLLSGYIPDKAARPSGFWTVEYYQPYFDVDTLTVGHEQHLWRGPILKALNARPSRSFAGVIQPLSLQKAQEISSPHT